MTRIRRLLLVVTGLVTALQPIFSGAKAAEALSPAVGFDNLA